MSSTTPVNSKPSFFEGRKLWFLISAALGLIATILLVLIFQGLTSTTTYYVLNQNVPARTLITQKMLTEVVTSTGGQPPTALDVNTIGQGDTYSKFALNPGDVVTSSNAGDLTPLTQGLPDNYVVASFTASPNLSAGGNIQRGDYINITAVLSGGTDVTSHMILQRVLVLGTTSDLEGTSGGSTDDSTSTDGSTGTAEAGDQNPTSQYASGVPAVYTVGVTQEDANKIALATQQSTLYLTLTSEEAVKKGAQPADIENMMTDLFTGEVGDSGKDTDNSFSDKKDSEKATSGSASDSATAAPSDAATTDSTTTDGATNEG